MEKQKYYSDKTEFIAPSQKENNQEKYYIIFTPLPKVALHPISYGSNDTFSSHKNGHRVRS